MTNNAPEPDIAAIRQLLLAAFTPEDLRRFCYDRPDFRLVGRRFSPRHNLEDMVDELIAYCENFLLFHKLLAELKQHNPSQYTRFLEPELSADERNASTPEILTISYPISLHLVCVPTGEFQMGSFMSRDEEALDDELPPHPVNVPEFRISRYLVTNRQYQAFVQATGHQAPNHWEKGRIPHRKQSHPVVWVTWNDAVAFCTWLCRETERAFRLPTEAEWEKAARGTDGRIYPWGDDPPDGGRCNFGKNVGDSSTIGRYSPQGDGPYGCADMAGNVWEWCQSLYEPYPYQEGDGRENPQARGSRVLRGGAWYVDPASVRCAFRGRLQPGDKGSGNGFRVAAGPLG